jgi:hypothetical protein
MIGEPFLKLQSELLQSIKDWASVNLNQVEETDPHDIVKSWNILSHVFFRIATTTKNNACQRCGFDDLLELALSCGAGSACSIMWVL